MFRFLAYTNGNFGANNSNNVLAASMMGTVQFCHDEIDVKQKIVNYRRCLATKWMSWMEHFVFVQKRALDSQLAIG